MRIIDEFSVWLDVCEWFSYVGMVCVEIGCYVYVITLWRDIANVNLIIKHIINRIVSWWECKIIDIDLANT